MVRERVAFDADRSLQVLRERSRALPDLVFSPL
jgi:hypothetical protein